MQDQNSKHLKVVLNMAFLRTSKVPESDFTENMNGRKFLKFPHCVTATEKRCTILTTQFEMYLTILFQINETSCSTLMVPHWCSLLSFVE